MTILLNFSERMLLMFYAESHVPPVTQLLELASLATQVQHVAIGERTDGSYSKKVVIPIVDLSHLKTSQAGIVDILVSLPRILDHFRSSGLRIVDAQGYLRCVLAFFMAKNQHFGLIKLEKCPVKRAERLTEPYIAYYKGLPLLDEDLFTLQSKRS